MGWYCGGMAKKPRPPLPTPSQGLHRYLRWWLQPERIKSVFENAAVDDEKFEFLPDALAVAALNLNKSVKGYIRGILMFIFDILSQLT